MNTNFCFNTGKLTTVLDAQAGSSGKGKIGSFITKNADNWQFACNTFAPQAGHWCRTPEKDYFYQTLNSCAYQNNYEKIYLGPGAIIELPALFREMEESNVPAHRLGIHPLCGILQDIDAAYERGEADLHGTANKSEGTMKSGSTCHGVGAALARRRLRMQNTLLARDVPELKKFLCNTTDEIMDRLDAGQAGLLEVAQGFQLSYLLPSMYPHCTSRNCTVSAGLDDMFLPPKYAGNVILNLRTYPIRISNLKYIAEDGKHLTWDEIQECNETGKKYEVYVGNSGPGYDDQEEISWEEITKKSGSPTQIIEMTSVTKLPRRAFTFSRQNLEQAIRHNDTGHKIYLSLNFANYVDFEMFGRKGPYNDTTVTPKMEKWIEENGIRNTGAKLKFIGTSPRTDDFICC